MKKLNLLKSAVLAVATLLTTSAMATVYTFSGNFSGTTATIFESCSNLVKNVSYSNSAGCGAVNVTVLLQRSTTSSTSGFGTVASQTGGGTGFVTFPAAAVSLTGWYRFVISGSPSFPSSCGASDDSFTTYTATVGQTQYITIKQPPVVNTSIYGSSAAYPTVIETYSCLSAVNLTSTSSGTIDEHRITVIKTDASGATITGTGAFNSNPSGTWTSGFIPSTTNLNTGTIGASFAGGGYYKVTVEARNSLCSAATKTSFLHVNTAGPTATASFKVNSTTVPTVCTTPLTVNSCAGSPINFNNFSTNATQYLVELQKSPTACGTYTSVYSSGYVSTFPTDLRNLPGTGGTQLQSTPGFYKILLTTKNLCGATSTQAIGFIQVILPVSSAEFQLIKGGGIATIGTEATSFSAPADAGSNSVAITGLANTSPFPTNLTHYQVTVEEFLSSGLVIGPVCSTAVTAAPGGTLPTVISLNDIDFAPSGYFILRCLNGPGFTTSNIFKVTVQTFNECGAGAAYSKWFYFGQPTVCFRNAPYLGDEEEEGIANGALSENEVSVFPNPSASEVNFEINAVAKDRITIAVYDTKGNHVMNIVKDATAVDGTNVYNANIEALNAGMYLYTINVNNKVYNGKLSKQ